MQLHTVQTGFAGAARALSEGVDRLPDLRPRHPAALEAVPRFAAVSRAERGRVLDATDVALASRVAELEDEFAVVLVHARTELPPEGDRLVPVDGGVARHDAAADGDGHEGGDDGAAAAAGELQLPVDADRAARAVVVVESPRDVRAEDPVLDREVAKLERLKDDVHPGRSPFTSHAAPRLRRGQTRNAKTVLTPEMRTVVMAARGGNSRRQAPRAAAVVSEAWTMTAVRRT